jgi:hypothetical protein
MIAPKLDAIEKNTSPSVTLLIVDSIFTDNFRFNHLNILNIHQRFNVSLYFYIKDELISSNSDFPQNCILSGYERDKIINLANHQTIQNAKAKNKMIEKYSPVINIKICCHSGRKF